MSEAVEPGLLRKLRTTPWRDLLRGRLTQRLDVRRRIQAAADLPEPARALVLRVVQRTRLWPAERLAVADELLGHFADGLAAGESAATLIDRFGDERQAAKLIARAQRRNRPLPWRALVGAVRVLEAVIILHLLLAAWFFLGRPTFSVDYVAEVNRAALAAPVNQRAWPLYRQALLGLRRDMAPPDSNDRVYTMHPGSAAWPWMVAYLHRHAADLQRVRQGAACAVFGFIYGWNGSIDDPAVFPRWTDYCDAYRNASRPMLQSLEFDDAAESMGGLAEIVAADEQLALREHDANRCLADLDACLGLAHQLMATGLGEPGPTYFALIPLMADLQAHPSDFSDGQLAELAHRLATLPTAANIPLWARRLMLPDVLQRMYTDDGHGDGRLTAAGMDLIGGADIFGVANNSRTLMFTYGPYWMLLSSSRAQTLRRAQRMWTEEDAMLREPLSDVPLGHDRGVDVEWLKQPALRLRYPAMLCDDRPPREERFSAVQLRIGVEHVLGLRDGLITGFALEAFRRQRGHYPTALAELVPALLPQVPADRFTGEPVRYRLIDGQPTVYSVGYDHTDDGGHPPIWRDGTVSNTLALYGPWIDGKVYPGDWILYPAPEAMQMR